MAAATAWDSVQKKLTGVYSKRSVTTAKAKDHTNRSASVAAALAMSEKSLLRKYQCQKACLTGLFYV